jgi:hypothetical protein
MATVAFSSLVPEVLTYAPGCSEPLAVEMLRAATVELCESAPIMTYTSDPVTVGASDFPYQVDLPDSNSRAVNITALYWDRRRLEPMSTALMNTSTDYWKSTTGQPTGFVSDVISVTSLYPLPDMSGEVITTVQIAPSWNASSTDADLVNKYRKGIVSGALARILMVPSQPFTSPELAAVHAASFGKTLQRAKVDANRGMAPAQISVALRGFA